MISVSEELGYILEVLKKKIMLILGIVLSGMVLSFWLIVRPLLVKIEQDLLPEGAELIQISPVEVIMLMVKIGLIIGILLASPLIGYYVYKTLRERLGIKHSMKRRYIIILAISAVSLFILGICYSYFLMLPLVLKYLYGLSAGVGVPATYSISEFVSFVVIITLILGIAFELPVMLVFAVQSGLVQLDTLKENRRYVIVAMFVLAAIFTPPDPLSQLIVALPLIACYEAGIRVASVLSKRHALPHKAHVSE
jgi:sec-independent protein translocase protein TatC